MEAALARHDERIGSLEKWRNEHADEHLRLMTRLEQIAERPSWVVSLTITMLCSTVVGLLVALWG